MKPTISFLCVSLLILACSEDSSEESKSESRYRFKTGSYVEATRNETFSLCPPQKTEGTWVSEHSVALNAENCISIQAPDIAGSFDVLFLENSGLTDSVQVLVDQSYIQMGDYSHKIWVSDLKYQRCISNDFCLIGPGPDSEKNGRYENRSYTQPLIVDKTIFIMADAQYYSKISNNITFTPFVAKYYPENENLEKSKLPYIDNGSIVAKSWRIANERSKKEGLDTVYYRDLSNEIALDVSASGYRVPTEEEWFFLMRAGASTRYYWGDEEDSLTVSRYEWFRPIGLKPVAQLIPNRFGLYDMVSNAREACTSISSKYSLSAECWFMEFYGIQEQYMEKSNTACVYDSEIDGTKCTKKDQVFKIKPANNYQGFRLLRKTPKLQKLEKF